MFKKCSRFLAHYLVFVFNGILDSGQFPVESGKAIIVPLFKKGDRNDVSNYRGISLLPVLSQIFTGIMKLSDEQIGFRKSKSTVDHIFVLQAVVQVKRKILLFIY